MYICVFVERGDNWVGRKEGRNDRSIDCACVAPRSVLPQIVQLVEQLMKARQEVPERLAAQANAQLIKSEDDGDEKQQETEQAAAAAEQAAEEKEKEEPATSAQDAPEDDTSAQQQGKR